jgi:hypothetical protein
MGFLQTVLVVARKDLLVEFRSREILHDPLFFAVACVLVFAFGFVREGQPVDDVTAGILWIAIAFSERWRSARVRSRAPERDAARPLMAPIDRPARTLGSWRAFW